MIYLADEPPASLPPPPSFFAPDDFSGLVAPEEDDFDFVESDLASEALSEPALAAFLSASADFL